VFVARAEVGLGARVLAGAVLVGAVLVRAALADDAAIDCAAGLTGVEAAAGLCEAEHAPSSPQASAPTAITVDAARNLWAAGEARRMRPPLHTALRGSASHPWPRLGLRRTRWRASAN
jgi:hypothetical protein